MLVSERAEEVRKQPGEWFWWKNRHATVKQVQRWLDRIAQGYEVKGVIAADHERVTPKFRNHIKVRWK